MIQKNIAKFKEVANYTNISNVFEVDCLLCVFVDLSSYQRDILIGICVITMLFILITNVTVIICLLKTNQTNNISFRTILHLNFSDVLFAFSGVPTFTFGSVIKTSSRILQIMSPCFIGLFSHLSMYIIGLIGMDRFVRINYYTKYREILAPFRVSMAQILIWGLALLDTVLILLDILNQTGFLQIFVALCDVSLIIVVTVLQIKTISSMKTLLVLSENSLDRKIRKLATKILIAITLLLPPSIFCAIVRGNIESTLTDKGKGNLQFIFGITTNLIYVNSSTNAVLFLASNVKSKKYLRSILKRKEGSSGEPESTEPRQKMSLSLLCHQNAQWQTLQ